MQEQFSKVYFGLGFFTVLAGLGLALFIFYTHPGQFGTWGMTGFYVLLWCCVFGFVGLLEFVVRRKFISAPFPEMRKAALRQAALTGILVVALLIPQAGGILYWWVAASLVLLFICVEAFLNL